MKRAHASFSPHARDRSESIIHNNRIDPRGQCIFLPLTGDDDEEESVRYVTGILHGGSVDSSGSVGGGLVAESSVNGSGMLLFGSALQENRTMVSRGFVTGNLSVHDLIRQGGRV